MAAAVDQASPARLGRARGNPARAAAAALGFGLLFFACLQLALAVLLERPRSRLRDPEFAARLPRLRARLAERPGAPLVLVLGSSRPLIGFCPAALPPLRAPGRGEPVVFNASFIGAGPFVELVCLHRLLAAGARPDWLVLEYWPPTEMVELARALPPERLTWSDLAPVARCEDHPGALYWGWALARLLPFHAYHADLLRRYAPAALPAAACRDDRIYPIDDSGWARCTIGTTAAERQRLRGIILTSTTPFLQAFHPAPAADRALHDLLATCRRERIGVVLVSMPESSAFRDAYPPAVRSELAAYLRRVGRECAVPWVDARTWSADDEFADGVHLLPDGAAAFTARFGREVLQPLLQGRQPLPTP